jgi:1-acyl-sn-glycerol-3-phosphate acyltransferase
LRADGPISDRHPNMSSTDQIPQSTLRAVLRLIALIVAVAVLLPLLTIILTVAGIAGSTRRYRLVMALTPIFCRIMAATIGLRVRVAGRRAAEAKIFVANHVSYTDILVAGIAAGGVFVSRHDVKDWPVIGLFARLAGTVFLDRRSLRSAIASSAGIVERARQGIRIALFPEGGTTPGEGVGGFKPFLFGAMCESGFVVQPITIRYTSIGSIPVTGDNKTLIYWYDPAPSFTSHGWRLLKLRNVNVTATFHEPVNTPLRTDNPAVREFAELLRDRVASGL